MHKLSKLCVCAVLIKCMPRLPPMLNVSQMPCVPRYITTPWVFPSMPYHINLPKPSRRDRISSGRPLVPFPPPRHSFCPEVPVLNPCLKDSAGCSSSSSRLRHTNIPLQLGCVRHTHFRGSKIVIITQSCISSAELLSCVSFLAESPLSRSVSSHC